MPKLIKNIIKKVVVFDLDETLGYFGELGRFCNLLDEYYKYPNNGNTEEVEISEKDLLKLGYGKNKCPTLQEVLPYAKQVLSNI